MLFTYCMPEKSNVGNGFWKLFFVTVYVNELSAAYLVEERGVEAPGAGVAAEARPVPHLLPHKHALRGVHGGRAFRAPAKESGVIDMYVHNSKRHPV
jgi:hypothetical protein